MRQLSFTSNYSHCMTSVEKPTHKHTDIRTKTNTFSAKNYVVWEYLCKTSFSPSKNVKLNRLRLKNWAKNICCFATVLLLLCMLLWHLTVWLTIFIVIWWNALRCRIWLWKFFNLFCKFWATKAHRKLYLMVRSLNHGRDISRGQSVRRMWHSLWKPYKPMTMRYARDRVGWLQISLCFVLW